MNMTTTTQQPPRFAVQFLDLPKGSEPQRAGAPTFTAALATVATARGSQLSGTVSEYDTKARRFLVFVAGSDKPTAFVRDLRPFCFA